MRVLVLDSDPWREEGIARVLDREPGLTPILERDLGEQTLSRSHATVVVVAETAARHDHRRSLERLRLKFPQAKILVTGEHGDPALINDLLTRGADGYFALSLGEEKLVKAIRVLQRGAVWLPERAVTSLVQSMRTGSPTDLTLSAQERSLLSMLSEGLSNKEMAQQLGVAEITIKSRLARLCRRFGVRTRVQLLSYAVRAGLAR